MERNMELERQSHQGKFKLQGFRDGAILIDQKSYTHPIIITNEEILNHWQAKSLNELCNHDFEDLISLNPEMIIIGTGQKHQFLSEDILENCFRHDIPVECMSTEKACMLFPTLIEERKKIIAVLFP